MKHAVSFAILILFAAASLPAAASTTTGGTATQAPQQLKNCVPSRTSSGNTSDTRGASKAPPIRVCAGDSDTQLNLPWFITDVLTAVDTHQSPRDLLRKMRDDF
ncbi:hypothetical protein [Burkholderia latens]|uniref:hypothetical protein n=1 Tax=Burkholderia latens TaxID=488446 RepID=UPI001AEB4648|nr:hypothetical protein [Burkholderia latens]QTO51825.1 hypothetical protein J8I86_19755 [Burkholderia latens]